MHPLDLAADRITYDLHIGDVAQLIRDWNARITIANVWLLQKALELVEEFHRWYDLGESLLLRECLQQICWAFHHPSPAMSPWHEEMPAAEPWYYAAA